MWGRPIGGPASGGGEPRVDPTPTVRSCRLRFFPRKLSTWTPHPGEPMRVSFTPQIRITFHGPRPGDFCPAFSGTQSGGVLPRHLGVGHVLGRPIGDLASSMARHPGRTHQILCRGLGDPSEFSRGAHQKPTRQIWFSRGMVPTHGRPSSHPIFLCFAYCISWEVACAINTHLPPLCSVFFSRSFCCMLA